MMTLFLTLGLSLVAALQAQDPPASGEETPDVSGKWYLKAVTADREISREKLESMTPLTLTVLEGGDLEVKVTVLVNGQCQEKKIVLEKTEEAGKYEAHGGESVMYVTRPHVQDHYILYCEGEFHEEIRMAKLVGRDPEDNEEALEEFKDVARARGFDPEKTVIPMQTDVCSSGAQ